jgi:asparagine synthase (glutamine-hydrolysing)
MFVGIRDPVLQRAWGSEVPVEPAVRDAGYKVVLTGEGADEILGGYPHFRRDMLLYNAHGGDPAAGGSFLKQLDELNPVSRGLLLPAGEAGPLQRVKRLLGFVP